MKATSLFQPFTPKPVDPFYSPILGKLDQIFLQLGHSDESCRERLVCNMYKTPTQYSPHSNYVSAELSRYVIIARHSKHILPFFRTIAETRRNSSDRRNRIRRLFASTDTCKPPATVRIRETAWQSILAISRQRRSKPLS